MANTLITPDTIADMAIANLYDNAVMAGLVNRNYENAFVGAVGDTVTIRKPTTFTAEQFDRDTGITIQDATEGSLAVKLDKFKDVSFAVTSEDWTLNIQDFNEQFVAPAMEAINQQVDADLLSLSVDVTQTVGDTSSTPPTSDHASSDALVIVDAGEKLDVAKVPKANRRMVASATTSAKWIADPAFYQADKRGGTQGLTEAEIGRKFGFDNFMDQNVADTGDATLKAVAFHRDAFTLVSRPLALPKGAANAAIRNYKGMGLRVVYDYDVSKKQDVVSIDILYGVQTLDAAKAVLVQSA